MQFLHQEVESLACGAACHEHASNLAHVSGQARELFGDVDLGCEHRELLLEPLLVGIEARFAQTRTELVHERRVDGRNAWRDACDLHFDRVAALLEHGHEFGAFAAA